MFLMNILRGDIVRFGRIGLYYEEIYFEFVLRIKFFCEIFEKEIVLYVVLNNIEVDLSECFYVVEVFRVEIRDWINEMEEKYLGMKY